jgi:hypothetical protein
VAVDLLPREEAAATAGNSPENPLQDLVVGVGTLRTTAVAMRIVTPIVRKRRRKRRRRKRRIIPRRLRMRILNLRRKNRR